MKKYRPLPGHTVEVLHNGIRHQAEYTVTGGIVSVTYGKVENTASSPRWPPEIEARELLREILEGDKWRF